MMEEIVSGIKRTTESYHIQGSQQKRPYSAVFRECQPGGSTGYSDGHISKRIKGLDHETISEHKIPSNGNDELLHSRSQHGVGFDSRNVEKASNHHGTVRTPRHDDHNEVVPSVHRRRSAAMLKLPRDDDDEDEEKEMFKDGGGIENSTSSSSDQSSGQPPNQPPDHPPNQPPDRPPNQPPDHPPNQPSDQPPNQSLHQAPIQRPVQSNTPPEASSSSTQGEGVVEQPPQFPDGNCQITQRGLMPFNQCNGVVNSMPSQDWESSDNVNERNYCSPSRQLCISQPESCSSRPQTQPNSQSDELDGRCFRSQSQGSSRNSMQRSECFTLKDSEQETESSTSVYYPTNLGINCYYTVGETAQQMESNSAAILGQDLPSAQAPSDHQSEVTVHSGGSQLSARANSGDTLETDHLSLNQNQVPPTEDL